MNASSSGPSNKANIFLGLIDYELNSLLGASHLIDCISVHIQFHLDRYFLKFEGMIDIKQAGKYHLRTKTKVVLKCK